MDMANQFLSLAMFIMLLSFFIILNALSNFEDIKFRPVLNSLTTTFSNNSPEDVYSPNVIESTKQSINEGDTLDKLKRLFNAHIVSSETNKNRLGTIMHIRMPLEQFQKSLLAPSRNNAVLAQSFGSPGTFTPTLVSLMQTKETEIPYRMDLVLNSAEDPAALIAQSPEKARTEMRKIALLTKRLEDSGLEKKLVSAGVVKGDAEMIDIYFTRYIPINPLGEATE